jgi:hypothetical protein
MIYALHAANTGHLWLIAIHNSQSYIARNTQRIISQKLCVLRKGVSMQHLKFDLKYSVIPNWKEQQYNL